MHEDLARLQRELSEGLAGLAPEQTQLRTEDDPARWSIQQIVAHLQMTYDVSAKAFENRLARGSATKARPTLRQWIGQIVVLRWGRFPKGRAAPAMVMPPLAAESLSGEALAAQAQDSLARFDASAVEAEKRFGKARAITHPVLGPMSVLGWRRFHLVHGIHHLGQILAIRKAHGMPLL